MNTLIILRLLQGVYNQLTRLQQGRKLCKSMFLTLYQSCIKQGCYNKKFPYGMLNINEKLIEQ